MRAGDTEAAAPSDADLLERARGDDLDAFGELYARHREAAARVARAVASDPIAADDLVSSAFERIHGALRRGHGPADAFRPYLYTVIRRLAIEHSERGGHEQDVDDWGPLEGGFALPDADAAEGRLVATAFGTLPERHQAVLWYLDVEGLHPADVAPMLGLSANAVSALAIRARDGLRDAYLQAHVSGRRVRPECGEVRKHLGAYVGGRISDRDRRKVELHLETCEECPLVVAELREERGRLRAILLPLVIGGAAATLLGALGSPEAAQAAGTGDASVATMTRQAVRRPGLWVAAAATVALLLGGGAAVVLAPRSGSGVVADAAGPAGAVVPALASGEPVPDAASEVTPNAGDGPGGNASSPVDEPGVGQSGQSGAGADPGSHDGTGGASGGDPRGTAPSPTASETGQASAPPAPPAPAAPLVPTVDIGLTINHLGSALTGDRSAGTVTVQAKNVGPVSLGGTLTIDLPSGVQYDDGLVRSILGLVGSLVTTGAVQTCSHSASQVVCRLVALVPGAAASVSIPVAVPSGSEGARPTASFLLG